MNIYIEFQLINSSERRGCRSFCCWWAGQKSPEPLAPIWWAREIVPIGSDSCSVRSREGPCSISPENDSRFPACPHLLWNKHKWNEFVLLIYQQLLHIWAVPRDKTWVIDFDILLLNINFPYEQCLKQCHESFTFCFNLVWNFLFFHQHFLCH